MKNDSTSMADPSPKQHADAAMYAMTYQAKAANLASIAEITEGVHQSHVAAHIRGMVAATMGRHSGNGTHITRDNAEHWQAWALGVANGVAQTAPAVV